DPTNGDDGAAHARPPQKGPGYSRPPWWWAGRVSQGHRAGWPPSRPGAAVGARGQETPSRSGPRGRYGPGGEPGRRVSAQKAALPGPGPSRPHLHEVNGGTPSLAEVAPAWPQLPRPRPPGAATAVVWPAGGITHQVARA